MPLQLLLVWYALCWIILHEKSRIYARWGSCILKVSCKKKRKSWWMTKTFSVQKIISLVTFRLPKYHKKCSHLIFLEIFLQLQTHLFWTPTLCTRNFRNVKLRLDFVEIWQFTASPILHEIQFWQIKMIKKYHFWQF